LILELQTSHGPAGAQLEAVAKPIGALVLGHGAGGGIGAPDLGAAARAAQAAGFTVALVEQPYRVAGRRSQAPASQLDSVWLEVIVQLRKGALGGLPIIVGGRSAGARVACRTAAGSGAVAVLCLAFPLHPPGRADDPTKSRLPELEAVRVPVLVVQGERDPFGLPPEGANRKVVRVPGEHSLRNTAPVEAAVAQWLPGRLRARHGRQRAASVGAR
jgi:predicted alpha/beta-hydrolase family hydrolase